MNYEDSKTINHQGTEFDIFFTVSKGCRGDRFDPPEPTELELTKVLFHGIDIFDEGAFQSLVEAINEDLESLITEEPSYDLDDSEPAYSNMVYNGMANAHFHSRGWQTV